MLIVRVAVGKDEFCLTCMEWREYDMNGRCKVCKSIIKQKEHQQTTRIDLENYSIEEFSGESDSEVENG